MMTLIRHTSGRQSGATSHGHQDLPNGPTSATAKAITLARLLRTQPWMPANSPTVATTCDKRRCSCRDARCRRS